MATCDDWLIVKVPPPRENPTLPEATEAPPGSVCAQAGVIAISAVEETNAVTRELRRSMTEVPSTNFPAEVVVRLARSCGECCEEVESLRLGDVEVMLGLRKYPASLPIRPRSDRRGRNFANAD